MWTRVQLKDKAKDALKNNYWKIILVSIIVAIIGGGSVINTSTTFKENFELGFDQGYDSSMDDWYEDDFDDHGIHYEDEFNFNFSSGDFGGLSALQISTLLGLGVAVVFVIVVVAICVGLAYSAFIANPVNVGANRFFVKSLSEKAEIKEVVFALDSNYKNIVKILFIRDLKLLGWSLLFVIPGIIKSYEYRMMPYLLAENPNLTQEETFRLSKQMMMGNKLDAFVLELSFLWWDMLSAMTAGIVGAFYVQPYKNLTYAALYEELNVINGYPARAAYAQAENSYVQSDYFLQEEDLTEETEDENVPGDRSENEL